MGVGSHLVPRGGLKGLEVTERVRPSNGAEGARAPRGGCPWVPQGGSGHREGSDSLTWHSAAVCPKSPAPSPAPTSLHLCTQLPGPGMPFLCSVPGRQLCRTQGISPTLQSSLNAELSHTNTPLSLLRALHRTCLGHSLALAGITLSCWCVPLCFSHWSRT